MQKNKLIKFLLTTISLISLSSCGFINNIHNFFGNEINFIPNEDNSYLYDGYYQRKEVPITYYDINKNYSWHTLNPLGNQKLLIVPIELQDGPSFTDNMLKRLYKAFFGDDINPYYSVKEFFEISSYGKLSLSGSITNPVKVPYKINELNLLGDYASSIVAEYVDNYINIADANSFDLDNDGFIDNVIFIYSNDFNVDASGAFWAWTTYLDSTSNNDKKINNYMWASYRFMDLIYDDYPYNDNIDYLNYQETHTYIHETGHLLGLDDYYNYSDSFDPSTPYDMQANNIGDHNIFSKFALGWVSPYVVTSSCTINLKTSAQYPEAILIKNNYNGTPFDEYLLLEYYTPTGLNKIDSEHPLSGYQMMDDVGVRLYHVDARVLSYSDMGNGYISLGNYTDDFSQKVIVAASNTPDRSYNENHSAEYLLLHLIDNASQNTLSKRPSSLNSDYILLNENQTIDKDYLKNYLANKTSFNDGEEIDFSITVSNYTLDSCEVTITF